MEPLLLKLWRHVPSGSIKREEVADFLQLSQKQVSRNLRKWQGEGWLEYLPGRGRGNPSSIKWHSDVESIYEQETLRMMEEGLGDSAKAFLMDWSPESKLRLMKAFQTKLGFIQSHKDRLVIPKRHGFISFHPHEALEISSANFVANVYNRLVCLDEKGEIQPELAHSWDLTAVRLRLYLRKEVKFHDGSILKAEDAVRSLTLLKEHPNYRSIWEQISNIRTPFPLVVDIEYEAGCPYILQLLTSMSASIFKESHAHLIGTGAFYLGMNEGGKTLLHAFADHFQERPLLDEIEFVQVPKDFDIVYRSSTRQDDEKTFEVASDSGFGVVILNADRDTDISRLEVRSYINYVIGRRRNELERFQPNFLPNADGCLIGVSKGYEAPVVPKPVLSQPLRLQTVGYNEQFSFWLKEVLEDAGLPVILVPVSFEDTIKHNNDTDIYVHGEVFELNQNLSYFQFLKQELSPVKRVLHCLPDAGRLMERYAFVPFEEWTDLHLEMELALLEASLVIPLYYAKRKIPFSVDLMNISIKHFGYVDFAKLWMKPLLPE